MSSFFLDTSALAKRYINEPGSLWVRSWILPRKGNTIIISRLATIEIVSLMMRKHREGVVSMADFIRNRDNFFRHARKHYTIVGFEPRVLTQARRLLVQYPLRTLDSIQLASALEAARFFDLTFVSADIRLLQAAAAEGLTTDDPNAHP